MHENTSTCSDPSVVASQDANIRTKELWWLHGHPHSNRYSDPKLVSLAALVRHDGVVYKDQKAFLYPLSAKATTEYGSMTWDQFDRVTETLAVLYANQLRSELREANDTRKQPTIALLGEGTSLEYFCTQLALQKLGVRVLLLAESNAASALFHLLDTCNAAAIITDSKNARTNTNGVRKLDMIETLPRDHQSASAKVDAVKFQDFGDVWERHSFIIHSSGSTGMPKPVIHTNRSMMLIARMYRLFQSFNVENWFLLFPLYHVAGISIALSNLPNGQILSFPPISWPPSSSTIFAAWETLASMGHPVHCVHCAPTLIENMYEHIMDVSEDFGPLAKLKVLQPGGAALSTNIVDALISQGVNVKTTYGSTETGPPFRTIPHTRDNPKCYTFRNLYPDDPFLKMEEVGGGFYECSVYKGFGLAAELWDGKDDKEPYRTGDLFVQDPPGSGYFTLHGRKDDLIITTNGENTNPGPLQLDIQSSTKVINKALALGHSKPCVGLLVEVHENHDPASILTRDTVWEAVQRINERYPTHSQILRSMIYVLPKGQHLPVTPKGNIKRKEAERIYASEIERLYYDDNFSTTTSISQDALSDYLRNLIAKVANIPPESIEDWTTLYSLGINSHLALSLRSSLSSYLNRPVSLGTFFENPSFSKLVSVLTPPSTPDQSICSNSSLDTKAKCTGSVNRIISTLSAEFKTWPQRDATKVYASMIKGTILLTGASGSLGSSLLTTLYSSPNVSKIYAMVRGPNNADKLRTSLKTRGLNSSILEGGKITVLSFSMQDPLLGLDIDTYHMLATTVTTIVHNAWKMDFNQTIEDFEGDCLRSTMCLIRLAHAGRPKTFAFTSSVSTCMGTGQITPIVPESPIGDELSVSLSTGYALSKYIVERITQEANKTLDINTKLLRVGQLCGSTQTGNWNTSEMWPIMFATSAHPAINALPLFPGKMVDWVPVDIAAQTISDVLLHVSSSPSTGNGYAVHNIVNPNAIEWSELIDMIQASSLTESRMEEVDMKEWVSRLNALANTGISATKLPGLKLLHFFESMLDEEEGHVVSKVFETGNTRGVSKALSECGAMRGEWIEMNVGRWRKGGFLV